MTKLQVSGIASVLLAIVAPAAAQTPLGTVFTYQGQLKDAGNPANGLHDLRFGLYDAAVGGVQVGDTLCADNVSVTDGLFTVGLDFGAQFAGDERYLEVEVRTDTGLDCANRAGFVILVPRQALTAAPNALNADRIDGLDSTAFLQSVPVPLTLSGTNNSHIIRGTNASTNLGAIGVLGSCNAATGVNFGGYFLSASTSGRGVFGEASASSGPTVGVWGENPSTAGTGVLGRATAATGLTYGVQGRTSGSEPGAAGVFGVAGSQMAYGVRGENAVGGVGVFGSGYWGVHGESVRLGGVGVYGTGLFSGGYFLSDGESGRGVAGHANAFSGVTYGGDFSCRSTEGRGVYGVATSDTGVTYGGRFVNLSTEGRGVFGAASAASGITYGGYFQCQSTSGYGVLGLANATTGTTYGVLGQTYSTDGRGVYGQATAATGPTYGVYGESASTSGRGVYGLATAAFGAAYGVYGQSDSSAAYGVWAQGNLGASGTKSFRIDHPDDPANKYLLHYAAESPEVINFYRGTVVLDGAGGAVVELPQYFAKINRTPSYMLTAVGAPMPMLHVAEEIDEAALNAGATAEPSQAAPLCSFRIAGGAPGAKVSWRVEALRNDRWVQTHGAPVEIEKEGPEKGTYQHPELYGQRPEMGMNYRPELEHPERERQSPPTVLDAPPQE
jgi:hypothetical protein